MAGMAYIGSTSSHGGVIISNPIAVKTLPNGTVAAVNACLHSCPIPFHGVTPVAASQFKTLANGVAVVRKGDVAGCGAVITGVHENIQVGG